MLSYKILISSFKVCNSSIFVITPPQRIVLIFERVKSINQALVYEDLIILDIIVKDYIQEI